MPEENPLYKLDDEALIKYLADQAEIHARRVLITEGTDSLMTFWHLVSENQNFIIATPWRDNDEKSIALDFIRTQLKCEKAKAYSTTSEAWLSSYQKGEYDPTGEEPPSVRPIHRPNRIEVVVIFAATKSKRLMRTLEMLRDPSGKLIDLKLMDRPGTEGAEEPGDIRGSMPSLFDDAS